MVRPQQSSIVVPKTRGGCSKSEKKDDHRRAARSARRRDVTAQSWLRTHSHSGSRASWARISRIARPVCSVSSSASAGTHSSSARARRVRTLDRWRTGARDHTPDSKAAWASIIVRLMSSGFAASTLSAGVSQCRGRQHAPYCRELCVFTHVQMCKPVAGFVMANL